VEFAASRPHAEKGGASVCVLSIFANGLLLIAVSLINKAIL
jgi:hypothetical protein